MKIQILKNKIVTNEASFDSAEEMSSWLEYHKASGTFGKNEYEKIIVPEQVIEHEEIQEVLGSRMENVDGVFKLNETAVIVPGIPASREVIPAITELIPAEYEIVDATEQEVKLKESQEAMEYLLATDHKIIKAMELNTPVAPEILEARSAARKKLQ